LGQNLAGCRGERLSQQLGPIIAKIKQLTTQLTGRKLWMGRHTFPQIGLKRRDLAEK